ncbi:hypothetical protein [Streptomyces mirabilis]|uniref:hypothetical protein n=1 Tax=Streptomyces mirabilis TaxID=68239 RepID=UPI0036949A04
MAGGNSISATTARRWCDEIIGLLAAKASRLDRALNKIAKRGSEVVLIDGTLIPTQRREPPEPFRQTPPSLSARPGPDRRARPDDLDIRHSTTPDQPLQDGACSSFVKYFLRPLILGRQLRF